MSKSPNRLLGIFLGIVYLLYGIYGFFLTSDTGFASTVGPRIIYLFETNPLHNLLHVVVGVLLLTAALIGPRIARGTNYTLGAIFLLVSVVGWILVIGHSSLNILAINGGDNVLSFATAAILLVVGIGADRDAPTAKSA